MLIRLTFKTPDALEYSLANLENPSEEQREEAEKACARWIMYSELVQIEIDTETKEARVIPVGEW